MPGRYAIAVHRIRDAVRSQCSDDQLLWASNEMATVLKEGDPSAVDAPIAWAGLAMAHRAQHEVPSAYDGEQAILNEAEERALYTLKQVMFANYHANKPHLLLPELTGAKFGYWKSTEHVFLFAGNPRGPR